MKFFSALFIILAAVTICAQNSDPLPRVEGPLLMTVWGNSPEIDTVKYFCDSLFIPPDFDANVTVEEAMKGNGYTMGSGSRNGDVFGFHTRGAPYRTLVVLSGSAIYGSREDIDRIEELAIYFKDRDEKVIIIDIDTEGTRNEQTKEEFARRLIPLADILILAESPIENYASALEKNSLFVMELRMITFLLGVFETYFAGGRCCD